MIMKYGFKLMRPASSSTMKNQNSNIISYVFFIADSYEDCLAWQESLSAYVIQKEAIDTVYDMTKKLGQGSFGNVFLGVPKSKK
jgi:hypothetical protein